MLSRLVVHLASNTKQFTAGLNGARGHVARFAATVRSRIGSASRSALGSINGLAGGITKNLVRGALGAVAGVAAGMTWGVKLAAESEQARVGFTTLLGSATAAKVVLAELEKFSASTPFALGELRDGSKLLLNAGVSTNQLIDRMTMLGDIAAGTGKPIGDFAAIYAKAGSTGKVNQETLNQLAERGVPIYTAMSSALGKSRSEMLDMVSKGKIGFNDLQNALASTTAEGGVFAGGMQAQSQTLSGLWSTFKDNAGFAFQSAAEMMMDAFDFKGLLNRGIEFAQGAKASLQSLVPLFQSVAATMGAAITYFWELTSSVFSAIVGASGATFGSFMELAVTALAMAEFGFKNWQDVAKLAFLQSGLDAVSFFGRITHFFVATLPALLNWFGSNWTQIWQTSLHFVDQVFQNLYTNVTSIMGQLWDFIASGGTASFNVAWTPLADGFVNMIETLPDIPARVMSPLEKSLQDEVTSLGNGLNTGMQALIGERLAQLDEFKNRTEAKLPDIASLEGGAGGSGDDDSKASGKQNKGAGGALARGSEAALQAIFTAQRANKTPEATLAEAKKQTGHLSEIASKEGLILKAAGARG